jgi:hypothetical protein
VTFEAFVVVVVRFTGVVTVVDALLDEVADLDDPQEVTARSATAIAVMQRNFFGMPKRYAEGSSSVWIRWVSAESR